MDIDARPSQWSDGREPAAGGLGGPLTEDASGRAGNEIGSSCPSASCVRLVAMTQMYCGPREESWGKSGITWGNTEGAGEARRAPAGRAAPHPSAGTAPPPRAAPRARRPGERVVDGPQRRVNVATAKRPMSALRASLSRRFAVSLRGLW